MYEEQLRKLKDIIEEREKEITDLNNRMYNAKNEGETEISRLNEDREKLRLRITDLELSITS